MIRLNPDVVSVITTTKTLMEGAVMNKSSEILLFFYHLPFMLMIYDIFMTKDTMTGGQPIKTQFLLRNK